MTSARHRVELPDKPHPFLNAERVGYKKMKMPG